jgi:hypothetical protein
MGGMQSAWGGGQDDFTRSIFACTDAELLLRPVGRRQTSGRCGLIDRSERRRGGAVGEFTIWLSGVSRQVLAQCPTERSKFVGLGSAILVTAGMATVSLWFALYTALKAPIWLAVIFALLWGLAIMSLDRLFVVSMHRYRNRLYYVLLAAPRFIMAVLLGFVISTPFVLQIFRPEINHQIKLMQLAERSAYFKNLPTNPVYLAVQQDQANVTKLTDEGATGGAAINPATDPTILGWQKQLATAQANEQTWFANLQCQLYGTALPGGRKCIQGNGPLAKDDQEEYESWKGQVSTLQAEIQQRTGTLQGQSTAQQKATQGSAKAQLAVAKLALSSAQQQLTLQTDGVTQNINADDGLLTQLKALGNATAGDSTLEWARILLFLVFLSIDIMPVFIKLLLNLGPESTYDSLLAEEERQAKRVAEHTRAVRQAAQRKAAQAEASGARDRLGALSAELPGVRDDIMTARLNVEREWLRRWEEDQLGRVASGQGITPADTGVGPMPSSEGWQRSTANGTRPWPVRSSTATRDGRGRPQQPGRRYQQAPADRPADEEGLWGWLGSLRPPWPRAGRPGRDRAERQVPARRGGGWQPASANPPRTGPETDPDGSRRAPVTVPNDWSR